MQVLQTVQLWIMQKFRGRIHMCHTRNFLVKHVTHICKLANKSYADLFKMHPVCHKAGRVSYLYYYKA